MRARTLMLFAALAACDDGGADASDPTPADLGAPVADSATAAPDVAAPDAAPMADAGLPADAAPTPEDAAAPPPPPPLPPLIDTAEALDAVDPFIGTGNIGFGYAALTPAAQVPNGLVKLGPDSTRAGIHPHFHHFSGFHFDDPDTRGFSHLHFVGTGVEDYGNLRVVPLADAEVAEPWRAYAPVMAQRGAPGVYEADLEAPAMAVRLTATGLAGVHAYSFADGAGALGIDVAARIADRPITAEYTPTEDGMEGRIEYAGSYTGRTRPFVMFFSIRATPPPVDRRDWAQDDERGQVWVFDAADVRLDVGLSPVDLESARAHRADVDARPFDDVAADARAAWAEKAAGVRIGGGTESLRRSFYTALYNVYRMPTRYSGLDGRYRGLDGEVHAADDFTYLTDLSLWDTFRTLHPWLSLTDHGTQRDSLRSLMAMADDGGAVPRWPAATSYTGGMIGTSADIVFADAALKGVEGVDYDRALTLLQRTADGRPPEGTRFGGRGAIEDYLELGYVPYEHNGRAVSSTLEYAYNDGALANLAAWLGRDADAARYRARGDNWRNAFDPETGFMRNRMRDGTMVDLGNADRSFDVQYVEGTAWHWAFYAPHDPAGLADAFGGPAALGDALEIFFGRSGLREGGRVNVSVPDGYYWHGNEPDLHASWLFAWTDRPHRVDYWVRRIQNLLYSDTPGGLPGNDDGGTMSAWYLLSAVGLYPLAGTDTYVIGPPLFPLVELDLGDGSTLRVEAPGATAAEQYVHGVTLDGQPVDGRLLTHADLLGGRTLRFDLRPTP